MLGTEDSEWSHKDRSSAGTEDSEWSHKDRSSAGNGGLSGQFFFSFCSYIPQWGIADAEIWNPQVGAKGYQTFPHQT